MMGYPVSLVGETPNTAARFLIDAVGILSYDGAVKEANALVSRGAYARVYIMVPSDYCCEMRNGKPTMVKHHLGEDSQKVDRS